MTGNIEIKLTPEGRLFVRRADGEPLTEEDKEQARRLANSMPGITFADVLRVFPGARVLTPDEARALVAVEGLPQ